MVLYLIYSILLISLSSVKSLLWDFLEFCCQMSLSSQIWSSHTVWSPMLTINMLIYNVTLSLFSERNFLHKTKLITWKVWLNRISSAQWHPKETRSWGGWSVGSSTICWTSPACSARTGRSPCWKACCCHPGHQVQWWF